MERQVIEGSDLPTDKWARRDIVEKAMERVLDFKAEGFHCSESVFLAVNEAFNIVDPRMVRAVTGFHGGGGTHRLKPGIELTSLLAEMATGSQKFDDQDSPVIQVQHLCGALAAGIMCINLLFGRSSPHDDLTCADELSYELHRRFRKELGHNECYYLRYDWVPRSADGTCRAVYQKGTQIAVETILDAHLLVPECPKSTESTISYPISLRK